MSEILIPQRLLGTAATIARDTYSADDLSLLFMQSELASHMTADRYSKAQFVAGTVESAYQFASRDNGAVDQARRALIRFVILVAKHVARDEKSDSEPTSRFNELREAARAGGYDLVATYETTGDIWQEVPRVLEVRLLPLDDPQVAVSKAVSVLEEQMGQLDLTVALNSYKQAVHNLVQGNLESSNSQMRATLEEVVVQAATRHGYRATQQPSGGKAISYLIDKGHLPDRDGGAYLRGLWQMTHTNGSHPGTSQAGEAFFRMQAVTAAIRFVFDTLFQKRETRQ